MVLPKKTTRDLIGEYIDLDIERQWEEDNEAQLEIEDKLQKVQLVFSYQIYRIYLDDFS